MNLGNFSISLAVKDLKRSREFYQKLGFDIVGGKEEEKWLILKNSNSTIGLFQDMFPKNILTFNPNVGDTDVREMQSILKEGGIQILRETEAEIPHRLQCASI